VPDEALDRGEIPYYRPPEDSPEMEYLRQRQRALDGSLPRRVVRHPQPVDLPDDKAFTDFYSGSGTQAASTTMVFARLLRNLVRDPVVGSHVVPIIPDEARTFGLDALF